MTYFEVRWTPEEYFPAIRVADRAMAEAIVKEVGRRIPAIAGDLEIHEITVAAGTLDYLVNSAISDLAEWLDYAGVYVDERVLDVAYVAREVVTR